MDVLSEGFNYRYRQSSTASSCAAWWKELGVRIWLKSQFFYVYQLCKLGEATSSLRILILKIIIAVLQS